ncbi:MAG TPA: hemolysin family protein [Thermoguttaceae bacterium]|nr:hemolysin family protein [Thermoguttaceae bacterium]
MQLLIQYAPWLVAMGILILCSAFFSASEAAFFYLGHPQRRRLASGNRAQQIAAGLLAEADRLLTAVLFWNLVVNLAYFTIASIISLALESNGYSTEAGSFAIGSLLVMIVLSEMLPKSLAVLRPRGVATMAAVPLAAMVRLLDPILPLLRLANLLSRRLFCPRFEAEPHLGVGDLERAVELSTSDATLLQQEQRVLQNIVSLSDLRVDELMRPRVQFLVFPPPVSLADLKGRMPPSGYLLVTEPDSDEVAGAITLRDLSSVPTEHLEHHAEPVVYVPWSTTVSQTLEVMHRQDRQVAAVVNEHGETIGILTFDDVLDTIFGRSPSRSERLLRQVPIRQVGPGTWHVVGMTSLRRLAREFQVQRPSSRSVTIAGVVQEVLQRLPLPGDQCDWGPFHLKVLSVLSQGHLLIELTFADGQEELR